MDLNETGQRESLTSIIASWNDTSGILFVVLVKEGQGAQRKGMYVLGEWIEPEHRHHDGDMEIQLPDLRGMVVFAQERGSNAQTFPAKRDSYCPTDCRGPDEHPNQFRGVCNQT